MNGLVPFGLSPGIDRRRVGDAAPRLMLFVGLLLGLAPAAWPGEGVAVTDFLGREIELDAPAERIVALAPHLVENLYTAGAGEALVGAVSHSDYPAAARALPEVGGYTSVSLEAVVALDPDLVVAWASGDGGSRATRERFATLGIPVYVDRPRRLDDVARAIVDLGRLAGHAETAAVAARRFRAGIETLRRRYADRPPVSVFYQVWDEPLQTLGRDQFVGQLIRLCGGRNIFADVATLAPKVSIESVLARDPEVIVASGMGDERPDWLDDWRAWPGLRAVADDQLHFVPPDLIQRPTLRLLDGARQLCEAIDAAR
nr:cobalamin-binding protein [Salinisphaera halophila]